MIVHILWWMKILKLYGNFVTPFKKFELELFLFGLFMPFLWLQNQTEIISVNMINPLMPNDL
jgi:hypothetical protein